MNISLNNYKKLSGSMLKIIAIITMLIDHSALILRSELPFINTPLFSVGSSNITIYFIMRKIGRLAFPLFCFLISEGVANTKNIKKYCIRLFMFAIISEIPFNLMTSGKFIYPAKQNIYFTLLLGVLIIYIYNNVKNELVTFALMSLVAALSIIMRVDYGLHGVLIILLMHVLKNSPLLRFFLSYPLLSGGFAALAAFIPISLYNNKRGFIKSNSLKFAFYFFYPLHILLLIAIKFILK